MKIVLPPCASAYDVCLALKKINNKFNTLLCVGADSLVDLFAPLVGEKIAGRDKAIAVFGRLNSEIGAKRLKLAETVCALFPYVLAVDSAVGKSEDVGKIIVSSGGFLAASAVGSGVYLDVKTHILAVVSTSFINNEDLFTTNAALVSALAETVAEGIELYLKCF